MSDAGRVLSTVANTNSIKTSNGVLLAKYDAQEVSDIFSVIDKPLRLVAFGLMAGEHVDIMRVWLSPSGMERSMCGKLIDSGELLEKPHTVGRHAVGLNDAVDEIVIDAKGNYRLVYRGDNRPNVQVVAFEDDVVTVNNTVRGIE